MLHLDVLPEEDKKLLHEKTLELLEKTGIVVKSGRILGLMAELGCSVDHEHSVIKFPKLLVEKAIATAPKSFILGGLNPEKNIDLGEDRTYLATDGQGCFVVDLKTGERRNSLMGDLIDSVVLADALEYIDFYWPMVTATDAKDEIRTLSELATCYRYTGKHIQTDVFYPEQVPFFIGLLEAILGSKEEVKARKILSAVCCSVSPLSYDPEMLEACLDLTEYEVPIEVLPMPISGATAPFSLLSTVLMNNVEVLAALTMLQLHKPGTPVIYGSAPGILDMKTGLFAVGSVEGGLQNAACSEMARYYGLPGLACGLSSDAKEPGIQAAMEKVSSALPAMLAGTRLLCGVGLLETAQCFHYEQLIIDEEIFGFMNRMKTGIRGGKDYVFADLISQIGAGGEYISHKSTLKQLRGGEHYVPSLISREAFDKWQESPKKDIRRFAREKAEKILQAPRKEYFSEEVLKEVGKVLASAEKALCS